VLTHVGAILFYIDATHRIKVASIDSIPYEKISDLVFYWGAHCNNDSVEIEAPSCVLKYSQKSQFQHGTNN